jgi:hypothetical protein
MHRIYDLKEDPYETNNIIEVIQTDRQLMEKFSSVLDGLPDQDHDPRYSRLGESIYDIPREELNNLSRRIHGKTQNMVGLAAREDYDDLKK